MSSVGGDVADDALRLGAQELAVDGWRCVFAQALIHVQLNDVFCSFDSRIADIQIGLLRCVLLHTSTLWCTDESVSCAHSWF